MPFSSEVPAASSFVSQSQSIHPALHLHHHSSWGMQREEGRYKHCLCVHVYVCLNVAAFVPKKATKKMCLCARFECALYVCFCACVSFACGETCECVRAFPPSVVFSSAVIPRSAICPSLKHQLFSEGPLGENETTGWLQFFFYPHKDVLLLPVLSFFQEVWSFFSFLPCWDFIYPCPVSLFLSPTSSLYLLTDNVDSASLCLFS